MKKILLLCAVALVSCSKDSYEAAISGSAPTVKTTLVHEVGIASAKAGGSILNDNGNAITQKGICWSTDSEPTVALSTKTEQGGGSEVFTGSMTNLAPDTRYYVRAYATNAVGTAYGNQFYFQSRIQTDPVADYDGNVYQTIKIGNQLWMRENLRTTHYCNGDEIPNNPAPYWNDGITAGWAYYQNDPANNIPHGKLYNWYVANDARNPCPCDWHVPTIEEWQGLKNFVGDNSGKLKQANVWPYLVGHENDATNETGFSAWPSGFRGSSNLVLYFGYNAGFWMLGNLDAPALFYASGPSISFGGHVGYETGTSIRCIKNQ